MSEPACLVCGGRFAPAAIGGLVQCTGCGFVSTDLALSHEELSRLYTSRYFLGGEYRDYPAERPLIERQFRRRLQTLLRFVPDAEHKNLFEIGAAYGFFLSVAGPAFQRAEGIDISTDAAAAARAAGLRVESGDFLRAPISAPLDVVCMWDTIEHLARPDLYLAKAASLMPSGAVIAISTGDIGSAVARLRGARWRQIHPPTHLHYFSRRTLARLLDRHGFEVRHVEYHGLYRSVDTIAFIILTIRHRQHALYRRLKQAGLLDWTLYLNLYDTMFVAASKR